MKQRVLTAMVGLAILAVVMIFFSTPVFNGALSIVCALAVAELLLAVKCDKPHSFFALCILIAVASPFIFTRLAAYLPHLMAALFAIVLLFFFILLRGHQNIRVGQIALAFFFSVFVPLFFSSGVFIRDGFGPSVGGLYVLWALGAAWLTDSGAFFAGVTLGKRKLAPLISPKKTVEGAVGGILMSTICMALVAYLYGLLMDLMGTPILVNYPALFLITPVLSVIGMLGDLSASVVKRQFGVKDFGRIMPGHGGIMDRFDSVLFTMPAVYVTVNYITVVTLR